MICNQCNAFYFTDQKHKHYGVWNSIKKEFQFGICECTKKKTQQKLYETIGHDAKKYRFEIKEIK